MEALLPAAKFLIYAVGIYFLGGILIALGVLGIVVTMAALNRHGGY